MKLTKGDVQNLGPGEYRDDEVKGLVFRVRATGQRAFALRYTLPASGRRVRLGLGDAALVSLADARKAARVRLAGIHHGKDPAKGLKASGGPTVGEVVARYLDSAELSAATVKEWRRLADVEVAPIADRPAQDLARAEIHQLGANIKRRAPYVANRTFGLLRAAYSWAVSDAGLLEATPFFKLKAPFSGEVKSKRVLSVDELRVLVFALDDLRQPKRKVKYRNRAGEERTRTETGGSHYADALAILLLTGVRRRAVIEARTAELHHLEEQAPDVPATAEWHVPPTHQKIRERARAAADPHVVPLSRQAAAIFRHRVKAVGGTAILFPRARAPLVRGRGTWWSSRWVRKLHQRMEDLLGQTVPPWRVHNLRHTLATHIEEALQVQQAITADILSHSRGRGVTGRYALARHLSARREALQAWADWLDGLRRSGLKVAGGSGA